MSFLSPEEIEKNLELLIKLGLVTYLPKFDRYVGSDKAFRLSRKELDRVRKFAMSKKQRSLEEYVDE